jgi:hypothetical protein
VIEIIGPRALVAFDGRVLELFASERSRRIHVTQILSVEIQRGGLLLEDGLVLDLRLVDGRHISVRFADGRELEGDLERLVAALSARLRGHPDGAIRRAPPRPRASG